MSRTIALIAGLLVFSAALAVMLTTSVYGDRGRDEINLSSIHELPVITGQVLRQPVPLQRPAPYAISLPYQWRGSHSALIEVRLMGPDGSLLADTTEILDNSRAPLWLQPVGDGSYWQHERAAFHSIRIPSAASGTVVLQITRIDNEPGMLVLFASVLPAPGSNPFGGSQADSRPTILERPGEVLALETEYGAPRPALAKASTFIERVQSLAPPWLPFPVPELLLAFIVAIGIFLYARLLTADVASPTRSR